MKRKLTGAILTLTTGFVTGVMIQHHAYDIAALFALAALIFTYHFFGDKE